MTYSSGNCPQCGVKFNVRESSIDTVRRCEACGFKFVLRRAPFSITGCLGNLLSLIAVGVFILLCCGGLVLFIVFQNAESPPPSTVVESDPVPAQEPVALDTTVTPPELTPAVVPEAQAPQLSQEPPAPQSKSDDNRTWSDKSGKFSTEARFGGMIGTTVVLHKTDGTTSKVQFDQLSDADREWIDARRLRDGAPPVSP